VKILRYIATSSDHQFLLERTLPLETGITYDVLKESVPNEEGVVQENRGVYIADVVKEPRMVYHRWPKLGAYYTVPMLYQSAL
jgi:hypothetical protein